MTFYIDINIERLRLADKDTIQGYNNAELLYTNALLCSFITLPDALSMNVFLEFSTIISYHPYYYLSRQREYSVSPTINRIITHHYGTVNSSIHSYIIKIFTYIKLPKNPRK